MEASMAADASRAASGASVQVRRLGWLQYAAVFGALPSPQALPSNVDFGAEFVGPAWLRWSAGPSLALTALAGWCGKRFESGQAVNLVRDARGRAPRAALPMQALLAPSTIDGRVAVRLQYPREAGVPWRWAVDELRPLGDGGWLGMMHMELPLLRRLHFPFLLTPSARA